MIMEAFIWVGTKAGEKVFDVVKDKVLGIEYKDVSVEDWAKTAALAIFAMGSLRPELSDAKKAELRFQDLQKQIDEVKKDIEGLKNDMAAFKWKVESMFYKSREETLWTDMLKIDSAVDSHYTQLASLGKSKAPLADKRRRASELANNIITSLLSEVTNSRAHMLGEDVGAGAERVRGFIELWRAQALRDADAGWDGDRLTKIYSLLEAKFTRALLIQLKCVRLLMEDYETLHAEDDSEQDAIDYYSNSYYPVLRAAVNAFRDMVEALAVNIMPLPTGSMLPFNVPAEVAGLLAGLDI